MSAGYVQCKGVSARDETQLQSFMGMLRKVKSEDNEHQFGEYISSEVQKIQREDLLNSIWQVCEGFAVVCPKDQPKSVPPK